MARGLEILGAAIDGSNEAAVAALARCVPEYKPDGVVIPRENSAGRLRLAIQAA